jgi:peptidoglycan/xylan/chitin deacetylase (PgdA/CDA1 family)
MTGESGLTAHPETGRTDHESARTVAVLAYHKTGEPSDPRWETWNYIPEATFAAQLSWLRDSGWSVIDAATFIRSLKDPAVLPERSALLTFDDGYRSTRDVALPWLQRFGYPAVIFVPTHFVGAVNAFDAGIEPEEEICSWKELQELERCGVSVQSHGATHRTFSELDGAEQDDEVQRSKALLEAHLNKLVELFAYPYGDAGRNPGATARILRTLGFKAAFVYLGGPIHGPFRDRYRLARIAMGPDTNLEALLS